jgi:hypothetical protein
MTSIDKDLFAIAVVFLQSKKTICSQGVNYPEYNPERLIL